MLLELLLLFLSVVVVNEVVVSVLLYTTFI